MAFFLLLAGLQFAAFLGVIVIHAFGLQRSASRPVQRWLGRFRFVAFLLHGLGAAALLYAAVNLF